ncbi:hypothetical protein AB2L28_09095 [Kineococcus sp. TBRC 1896]|uniref:Uncharacterized protein n=1 Tax=Kineococcus mangrovi TaxID=1660183 RepID=A0ABV4I144_9ACTN
MSTTAAQTTSTRRRLRRGALALVLTAAVVGGGTGVAFAGQDTAVPTTGHSHGEQSYGDDMLIAPQVSGVVADGSTADDSTTTEHSYGDDMLIAPTEHSYGDDMLIAPQVVTDSVQGS